MSNFGARQDRKLPRFVEREFKAYLGCRDPTQGFAWLECQDCEHHRCVLFSCKTQGFCPSCLGRRMSEQAAHWVDRVIPWAATRQWVLTVPWRRRWLLARRQDLAEGVLQVALRCRAVNHLRQIAHGRLFIFVGMAERCSGNTIPRDRGRGTSGGLLQVSRPGARFGERLSSPSTEDIERLADDAQPDDGHYESDVHGLLQLASLTNCLATGTDAGNASVRELRRVQPARQCSLCADGPGWT